MKQEWHCCKGCDRRRAHGRVPGLSQWRRARAKRALRREVAE